MARADRLTELNVVEQCLNLYKTDIVQKMRLQTHADPFEPHAVRARPRRLSAITRTVL